MDGDQLLIVTDPMLINVAKRTVSKYDIVPLYYNMRKALPVQLNNENIYAGLVAAFTGGNIGIISNEISKIWNSDVFISGSAEEKADAVECVKFLCCLTNFTIDYAKTLYKAIPPKNISERIKKYTKSKLPAFFEFAKDKAEKQVCARNDSFVNQIYKKVRNKNIDMSKVGIPDLNYNLLMNQPYRVCTLEIAEIYDRLCKEYRYMLNMKDEYADNMSYVARLIRQEFSETGYSNESITDMLIRYLYGSNKRSKQILWFCYGQYILNNLSYNLASLQC